MEILFAQYGKLGFGSLSIDDLLKLNCIARTEDSGSEGCYCEIARWNIKEKKFQRFAFCKFLGGEIENQDAFGCADHVTNLLNKKWNNKEIQKLAHDLKWDPNDTQGLIHDLEDWTDPNTN
jgi:hypothetical protein